MTPGPGVFYATSLPSAGNLPVYELYGQEVGIPYVSVERELVG
ncbi:MAG: hypothetical protein NTX53_13295 [candidate division WOR-3 bacterium]|nr:hypothetical protein [candidate division WOR-3 bacterium]